MNDPERSLPDRHLDRRTVLKVAAGASAAVVAPCAVSGAVLVNNNEIVALSARAAADYTRRGELSAERYAQALLERYKAHTNLNAVAHIDEAKLLEDAREVDRARVRGAQLGPLAGLPVIIKDNVNTVGFPTTAGTRFLKDYRPKANAPLADMIFKQGAILFAKSNMHELALGSTSANPNFGFVKNPYDLARIPGGSSGGTAAALAARIVPLGIGSDTTGSIRMPSHFCGTAGLRPSNPPTNKPYPVDGIVPLELVFDVAGPMARNVADVAFMHSAITRGPELSPLDLRGVRIGVPRTYFWETLDPDVAKIMESALDRLRGAGAVVIDVNIDDLVKSAIAVRGALRREDFRNDLADFLAREYPSMTMKDAIPEIPSKRVRFLEEDARDHPPSREDVKGEGHHGCARPAIPGRIPATQHRCNRLPDHANAGAIVADERRCGAPDLRGQRAAISGHSNPPQFILSPCVPRACFEHSGGAYVRRLAGGAGARRPARRGQSALESRHGDRSRAGTTAAAHVPQRMKRDP